MHNYIVENFSIIKATQKQLNAKLDILLARAQKMDETAHQPNKSVLPVTPIKSNADLSSFEEKLKADETFFDNAVSITNCVTVS